MTAAATLTTVGYEGVAPDAVRAVLLAAGVRTVADIRAVARSRKPGFAKSSLDRWLTEAGIGYVHIPALGTPAEGREAVRAGRPQAMHRIFRAHLAGTEPQAALAQLAERVVREPVCLLCFEADHTHCHRSIVAEALAAETGLPVHHLHPGICA